MINDVETAVNFIKSLPTHHGRGRKWREDPTGCALLVQHVLATKDHTATMRKIAERLGGTNYKTIRQLIHGHDASGMRWPEIRAALTSLGASWLPDAGDLKAAGAPPARGQNEERSALAASRQVAQDTHAARIAAAVEAIKKVPVGQAGRKIWASDPAGVAFVALALIKAPDRTTAIREVSAKAAVNESVLYRFVAGMRSCKPWPELRQQMKRLGVEPTPLRGAAKKHKDGTANGKDHVDPIAARLIIEPTPGVEVATLPPSAADSQWRIVEGTSGDIEITTRKVLAYGTPEHSAFLRHVLPECGTVRR